MTVFGSSFILLNQISADPLHKLTCKDETFLWSPACQEAFDCLKGKLVESLVLAYPDFQKDFSLETDSSVQG